MVGYNGRYDSNHSVPEAVISFERSGILEILVADVPMWLQASNLGNRFLASIASMTKKKMIISKLNLFRQTHAFKKLIYHESVVKIFPKVDCCEPIVLIDLSCVDRKELKKC
uniref:Protein kinase domain-containing protein n=1 Tax=Strongyloides venezuelensis TaxID=75913 RepID=A0A0K0FFL0_STRVS